MQDPARRNALGADMLDGLITAFDGLPEQTRVVVLRAGPEDTVWCAGFDIGALAPGFDPLAPDGTLHALFRRVAECKAPVIAMLHGTAWGGGTDLALRCDILIGDPSCTLAFTPARLGLPYDSPGLLNALLRCGPALAMEMFATARPGASGDGVARGAAQSPGPRAGTGGVHPRHGAPDCRERAALGLERQTAASCSGCGDDAAACGRAAD